MSSCIRNRSFTGLSQWKDGALTAGLAVPTMKIPIANALQHTGAWRCRCPRLDLAAIGRLNFERADEARFPCLALARAALKTGGALPTILNAANEIAVEAFMAGRIGFYGISELVEDGVLQDVGSSRLRRLRPIDEALAIDDEARRIARTLVPELRAVAS